MIIIPAIDIIGGRVVRLHQGDFTKEKFYSDDPVETALLWQKKGARFLHVVDLDGAKYGEVRNGEVIGRIIKAVDMKCEVGGGLRDEKDIAYFLEQGAERVVLGTKAFEDPDYLKKLVSMFGKKIVVSIDFAGERIVKKGWQEEMDMSPDEMIKKIQQAGVSTIVVTDIAMDGTLKGPNVEKMKKILSSVDISVIASGGISSLADIKKLKDIGSKNLEGVIIGRALYEGKINLEDAIKIS
ncbi:MAG: 1-(5-phosphoribosyl)-5-[(5-phosphoribosylamino)methylideneamino]imidazole-4-carboxamide isomerase [Candidatus Omnitrophica bacterium]|nr:1-(5-phosphoribosyl)-5-[(5-phosphoribosylamino)methylideneamino]imidazole-4-carboxamide isomerase [Candidatus Omnitrophota bacterium]MBU4590047.1 1-(5-phosphoribosyl)-5-[(5-phosphoribosylamino)methylideneamino]imidazole-4-carboxamide isomerase [Candidatus Omnitrophota bacterium]